MWYGFFMIVSVVLLNLGDLIHLTIGPSLNDFFFLLCSTILIA
ncbi:hypothetical protein PGPR2_16805 [Pseudomonas aeruginosa PGPR2]|nr:hypothetical protein PGPR2_16805 [Pseudomonas aeruginosa PGPR2]